MRETGAKVPFAGDPMGGAEMSTFFRFEASDALCVRRGRAGIVST